MPCWRQLRAVLVLPGIVTIGIPALIIVPALPPVRDEGRGRDGSYPSRVQLCSGCPTSAGRQQAVPFTLVRVVDVRVRLFG
jgi:hypothetical protein